LTANLLKRKTTDVKECPLEHLIYEHTLSSLKINDLSELANAGLMNNLGKMTNPDLDVSELSEEELKVPMDRFVF
jgi:hypothetical protein